MFYITTYIYRPVLGTYTRVWAIPDYYNVMGEIKMLQHLRQYAMYMSQYQNTTLITSRNAVEAKHKASRNFIIVDMKESTWMLWR